MNRPLTMDAIIFWTLAATLLFATAGQAFCSFMAG